MCGLYRAADQLRSASGGKQSGLDLTDRVGRPGSAHNILSALLEVAVRDRLILSNDAKGIGLPRRNIKRKAYLTFDQVELLGSMSGVYETLVLSMAYTGLRWGEVTALRVQDFDASRRRITVNENAVDVSGTIHVGKPKSHKSRSVPVPEFLLEKLQLEINNKNSLQLIFGDGNAYIRQSTSGRGWFASAVKKCQQLDATFPVSLLTTSDTQLLPSL